MGIDLSDIGLGLGMGLTRLGEVKEDRRKEELAQRLEIEREERAEARQVAREERERKREQARVAKTRVNQIDGKFIQEDVNSEGQVIGSRDANPYELDEIKYNKDKQRLDISGAEALIEGRQLDTKVKQAELAHLPEQYSLDRAVANARINEANASAERQRREPTERETSTQTERDDQILGQAEARAAAAGNTPAARKAVADYLRSKQVAPRLIWIFENKQYGKSGDGTSLDGS